MICIPLAWEATLHVQVERCWCSVFYTQTYSQSISIEIVTVSSLHRFVCVVAALEFDKSEPRWPWWKLQVYLYDPATFIEDVVKLTLLHVKREVTYVDGPRHSLTLFFFFSSSSLSLSSFEIVFRKINEDPEKLETFVKVKCFSFSLSLEKSGWRRRN